MDVPFGHGFEEIVHCHCEVAVFAGEAFDVAVEHTGAFDSTLSHPF